MLFLANINAKIWPY